MGWGHCGVCSFCWEETVSFKAPTCGACGIPLILDPAGGLPQCSRRGPKRSRRRPSLVTAYGPYEGRLRDLVRALKYSGCRRLARPLAGMMSRALAGAGLVTHARESVIVAVPLSRKRMAERGYNQAHLLACGLRRAIGEKGRPAARLERALIRVKAAPPQTSLSRRERLRNPRGVYAVDRRHRSRIVGSRVLLVDDVLTTGATLRACARALTREGAREVMAVVLARTPAPVETPGRSADDRIES
jgi:ComF family protein